MEYSDYIYDSKIDEEDLADTLIFLENMDERLIQIIVSEFNCDYPGTGGKEIKFDISINGKQVRVSAWGLCDDENKTPLKYKANFSEYV